MLYGFVLCVHNLCVHTYVHYVKFIHTFNVSSAIFGTCIVQRIHLYYICNYALVT